jgi:glyoxylase-like metal-dependent hydrolase (beta-lactamase superfamily II)
LRPEPSDIKGEDRMTDPIRLSRRHALLAGAAAPFVALAARPAYAGAAMMGMTTPLFSRFKHGDFEITTLLAGTKAVPDPHTIFGLNASDDDFAAASTAAFIPTEVAQFFFTPTVINTGAEVILFDTGTDPEGLMSALKSAGYEAENIDKVVLTHMHPDHIGGMMAGGAATFPNATYLAGSTEYDFWSKAGNELFDTNVKPVADKITMLAEGGAVAPGIIAIEAFGHTPGHMAFMVESGGKGLVITADTANHYIWSLAHPDWEVKFDADKPTAAATRRKLFGMIAADRLPFIGYHMPFPATGFIEAAGDGFRYVPSSYQLMLG